MFEDYDNEDNEDTAENNDKPEDNDGKVADNSEEVAEDEVHDEEEGHFDEAGNLKAETEYDVNGYHYETDEHGRISCCSGTIRNEQAERNQSAQKEVGGEVRGKDEKGRALDDGGHLIASRFGGSGEKDNLVAMDRTLNRSDYRIMENEWAKLTKEGNTVDVEIYCHYKDNTSRPDKIDVIYTVTNKNGEEQPSVRRSFDNKM